MEKSYNRLKKLSPIFIAGTGSDVGKSIVAAALCRIFKQDGYNPAPFKGQNMSLNSYVTKDGLEMGRAQVVQAEAAKIPCNVHMNPILLKPTGDCTAQLIAHGRPRGTYDASTVFSNPHGDPLIDIVIESYQYLSKVYNPMVLEGAGSPTEMNLFHADIANSVTIDITDGNVILVADIERGGIFASIFGTIDILKEHRGLDVKGIIINKFRGDMSLFDRGVEIIELLRKVPVLGVIPYYNDIHIDEEDSIALQKKNVKAVRDRVNVSVVKLKHISNFTDFNALERDGRVHLFYTDDADELLKADIIIIPGSKSTISDLKELKKSGLADAIIEARYRGTTVMGICGGYQMMGFEINDEDHVESDADFELGLGLLPVKTNLKKEKVTRQVRFRLATSPSAMRAATASSVCNGYEVHMGKTTLMYKAKASPLTFMVDDETHKVIKPSRGLFRATENGCFLNRGCFGTYIHGILDNPQVVNFLLSPFLKETSPRDAYNHETFKEEQYDKLADHFRKHLDMDKIYEIMGR
jgi:cobyric acid synthase CobQ